MKNAVIIVTTPATRQSTHTSLNNSGVKELNKSLIDI